MNRILRKDPIVEAVCEFRFDSPDWDWTVPGLLWNQLKDTFPLKQQFDAVAPDAPEEAEETLGVLRLNFWRQDKTALVRIEPNKLSIVQLKPYAGWPKFKAEIERVLNQYNEVVSSGSITRVSLRYVNRLDLPHGSFHVEDLFNIHPSVPVFGESNVGSWFHQVELFKLEEKMKLTVGAGFVPLDGDGRANEKGAPFHVMVLDIGAQSGFRTLKKEEEIKWLQTAHAEIETLFFGCLTDQYLKTLEPEEANENS
jgi:uncharacterized protein (TIGR04255 family)